METQSQTTVAELDLDQRRRLLMRIIAPHVRRLDRNIPFCVAFHLVYPPDNKNKPVVRPLPVSANDWVPAPGKIDQELEQLAMVLGEPESVKCLAHTVEPGFFGLAMVLHAAYRYGSSHNLLGDYIQKDMVVASLVTLDESVTCARYLLEERTIEFPGEGEISVPWDAASLKQVLFVLDDSLRAEWKAIQSRTPALNPVVLLIEAHVPNVSEVDLPDLARAAPAQPRQIL